MLVDVLQHQAVVVTPVAVVVESTGSVVSFADDFVVFVVAFVAP